MTSAKRGAYKKELERSGWIDGAVVAAGELRQGRPRSLWARVFGLGLIDLLKGRESQLLPRRFVLVVTGDRLVAFAAKGVDDQGKPGGTYHVRIDPGEVASFPRADVSITDRVEGGGTLVVGTERFRVAKPNLQYEDPSTDELLALLGQG